MNPGGLLERVEQTTISAASPAGVADVLSNVRQLRGWLDMIEGQCARRQTEHFNNGVGLPATDVIARGSHSSRRSADKAADRAEVLGKAAAVETELAHGRISAEHADVLANTAGRLSEDDQATLLEQDNELAQAAASQSPERFKRYLNDKVRKIATDEGRERSEHHRDLVSVTRGIDARTGMGYINATLHPDDWQKLTRKLDAEIAVLRKVDEHAGKRTDQLAAIAAVGIMNGQKLTARTPAEVMIVVDLDTLTTGLHADTTCEYSDGHPVPVETARRHACDANIIPAVLDSDAMPVDIGRQNRLASRTQRQALRSMYRECAIDGCDRHFDQCEMHHLLEWEHGGPTNLDNLLPICTYHHHRVHEGRWQLQLEPDTRQLTVTMPDGTHHSRNLPDHIDEHRQRTKPNETKRRLKTRHSSTTRRQP